MLFECTGAMPLLRDSRWMSSGIQTVYELMPVTEMGGLTT